MAKKGGSKNAKPGAQPYQPAGRAGGRGESATAAGRGKSGGRKGSGRGGGRGGRGGKNGGHAQPAAGTETEEELRREGGEGGLSAHVLPGQEHHGGLNVRTTMCACTDEHRSRPCGRPRGSAAEHIL